MTYQRVPKELLRACAKHPDWTPAEDQALREFYERSYAGDPAPQSELAKRLGRTVGAVRSRAEKIGISRPRAIKGGFVTTPKWSEEEEALLRELYPRLRMPQLLKRFPGRTRGSIFTRANVLGLQSPFIKPWTPEHRKALRIAFDRGLAIADVAAALGRKAMSVSKYATNHGLDFGARPLAITPVTLFDILALQDPAVALPPLVPPRTGRSRKQHKDLVRQVKVRARDQDRDLRRQERETQRARLQAEREREKREGALERQREVEQRREQRELERAQRQQAQRDDATGRANHRRAAATRQAARTRAQAMIDAGKLSVPKDRDLALRTAHRELLAKQEREQRESCPIEQAKLRLQRRGRVVYSASVVGGPKDRFVVSGVGASLTREELLAAADRYAPVQEAA